MNTLTKRIHRLPLDLRLWCIIPYTYQLQNKELLRDIRTYQTDLNLLDNTYGVQYTDSILLYDLMRFCEFQLIHSYNTLLVYEEINNIDINELPNCFEIWKRHYSTKYNNNIDLYKQLVGFITRYSSQTEMRAVVSRKIKFIFGLLTVEERTEFIEMYILDR